MESPDLVQREGSNDCVQNTSVVEKYEVFLRPIVGVDQLHRGQRNQQALMRAVGCGPYLWCYRGALHLVKDISDLFQVGDVSAIWIEGPIPRRALGEGIDEKFLNATGMDLEVKFVCDGV